MIESIILLLLLIPLGRGAGGWFGPVYSKLCSPAIGVVYGILLGIDPQWLPLWALAGWLSEKPDPASDAMGHVVYNQATLEDWAAFVTRGVLGAFPYLLIPSDYARLLVSLVIAWPLAVWLGSKVQRYTFPKVDAWQWSECFRYILAGLPLLFV